MPLGAGTRLGAYTIEALVGAGGMGEVYRARDTRLDRAVAIKVLPSQFAGDPQFRERFEREARSVSKLSHPNICTLHDIGTADDGGRTIDYLVLEYLEGETLAARLGRGALSVKDAVRIGSDIASALEAAHRQGIVHRDLKPGNVMLTRSGAKLLDFGLAKVMPSAAPVDASTELAAITSQGAILGTFQYMAPEQVEGHDVDARTDIFALGAVLYEMLTGRPAFQGRSQASLLGAILKDDPPPISETRPVAPALDHLVQSCLAKDPYDRVQTAHDVWLQLKWASESSAAAVPAVTPRTRRLSAPVAAGMLFAMTLGAGVMWWLEPAPPGRLTAARFRYPLPPGQAYFVSARHALALSPDGTRLAYAANRQLFVRDLDQLDGQPVRGTAENTVAGEPVFSPDGQWIAYTRLRGESAAGAPQAHEVKRIAITGGAPVTLATVDGPPFGISWGTGLIAIARGPGGIEVIPDTGGPSRVIGAVDAKTERAVQPHLLADGRHVMFAIVSVSDVGGDSAVREGPIVIQPLDGGPRKVVVSLGTSPQLLPTGHLVYAHDRTLFGVPFDSRRLEVTGPPVALVEGIDQTGVSGAAQYAVSPTGVFVYLPPGYASVNRQLVWVDREARELALAAPPGSYQQPRLSPDGTRIAVSAGANISIWSLDASSMIRLTNENAAQYNPAWTPDGRRVIYDSNDGSGGKIQSRSADGTGAAQVLMAATGFPNVVTADGRSLIYHSPDRVATLLPLDSPGQPRRLLADIAGQSSDVDISPNGRWVAYESNESGRFEVKVRPFPDVGGGQWQISAAGGQHPLWSRDGHELFFIAADGMMMSVPVRTAPAFTHGRPIPLFPASQYHVNVARDYDVSPDGKRFLMVKTADGVRPSMVIITDWFDDVRAKMRGRVLKE